jgi:cysteine-S-conjugate beta-lyase
MNFDEIIDRRGTHSAKWDMMDKLYGVPADTGLSMWVADMDFRPPACIQRALQGMLDHGIYGYFGDDSAYLDSIRWWMATRHGWDVAPEAILTAHGSGERHVDLCVHALTAPGDGVAVMAPVYHAFGKVVRGSGRRLVELPLRNEAGRLEMDFAAWDGMIDAGTKMLILCSPHNPGGRVWSVEELRGVADFCRRHDLILVSDEIHHDLVIPRHHPYRDGQGRPRGAGPHDPADRDDQDLQHRGRAYRQPHHPRCRVAQARGGVCLWHGDFGQFVWPGHGDGGLFARRRGMGGCAGGLSGWQPQGVRRRGERDSGVASMALESTYLAWVDFAGTGMAPAEFIARVEKGAGIAANHGSTFGVGATASCGSTWQRPGRGSSRRWRGCRRHSPTCNSVARLGPIKGPAPRRGAVGPPTPEDISAR